ncbi:hypothetical protein BAC2_02995 [uncultured bacterium]|nr:hypothetical protein BAC2_02995 [uncultured bacterium]
MSRKWFGILGGLLALTSWFMVWSLVAVPTAESQILSAAVTPTPLSTPPSRPPGANPQAPAISFIDNQSAACYRPVAETGVCYIDWYYLYVTASSGQYIISMTVAIDNEVRAYHSGFFQTTMYVPGDMYGNGFKVMCGAPGAGGNPALGNTYNYTIRARETGGLSSANYGSVTCPTDAIRFFLPGIFKR